MANKWEVKKLSDIVLLQRGHDLPSDQRSGGIYPVVASTSVVGYHSEYKVKDRCVLMGRSGTLGVIQKIESSCWPLNTTLYVKDSFGNDLSYIYYLLKTIDYSAFNAGSAVPTLNRNHLSGIEIKLPPFDEQVRIANVLSSLDNLIDNNKQQIQKTLELSRAYYDLIVKDVEKTVELKTIAEFNKQSTKRQDSGKVTYIEISNVKDGIIEWREEIDWSEAATSARRLVSKGDTIWSNVRPNRRSHSLVLDKPDNMVVTTGMTVISPASEKIGAAFLFATLDSEAYSSYLAQHADGTTYPTVGEEHFANSIVPMPEQKEIDKFEKVMFPLWEDAKRAEMDNIKLSKMRDELLPLLISGEITVKEAEEQIEG